MKKYNLEYWFDLYDRASDLTHDIPDTDDADVKEDIPFDQFWFAAAANHAATALIDALAGLVDLENEKDVARETNEQRAEGSDDDGSVRSS